MLSLLDYNELWTSNLGLPVQTIPCFYQYLQREVYFQDYMDLFGNIVNREPTFGRTIVNGHQTILIQDLQSDPNGINTVHDSNGTVRLIVDYDFPFETKELNKKREIKYILIGEAAPSTGAYIYKDSKGSYITAALSAVGVNTEQLNRNERLIEFANNGFLLLDFFPFAINFSDEIVTINNPILNFFINLINSKVNGLPSLNNKWDFCLVAPKRTSLAILNWLDVFNTYSFNGKSTKHPLDLNDAVDFISNGGAVYPDYTINTNLQIWPISHVSKRAKFTVTVGGSGPNAHLIKRAFNLP